MPTKVTFFLNAIKAAALNGDRTAATGVAGYAGISESWYSNSDFNSQAQYDLAKRWMQKRAPFLPANCTIVAFRLAEQAAKGKSIIYRDPVVGANAFLQDQPQAALKYKVHSTTSSAEKTVPLAFLPDDIIQGGVFVQSPNWQTAVNAFFNEIALNWKIKAIKQDVLTVPIDTIDEDGTVHCLQASGIVADSKVQILRSKTEEGNTGSGVFKIKVYTNATTFRLKDWKFGATSGGEVRPFVQEYVSVETYPNERTNPIVGTRKVGRPFDQSRGKATTRR